MFKIVYTSRGKKKIPLKRTKVLQQNAKVSRSTQCVWPKEFSNFPEFLIQNIRDGTKNFHV